MIKNIVVDSCFWIALFNERDQAHELALVVEDDIRFHNLLIPWPTLYEWFDTRFFRQPHNVARFKQFLQRQSVTFIDDTPYREASKDIVLDERSARRFSLVDQIIRMIIDDDTILVHGLVSFNERDFEDICYARGIELLCA